jgi:nucleoside-diphosphate-sugar epimerase
MNSQRERHLMKYLITGATGFIGPYLVKRLIAGGHHCRCLVRPQSHKTMLDAYDVEFVTGDITHAEALDDAAQGMDALIHMATLGHMNNYRVEESRFEAVNRKGTFNIMQAALRNGVQKIVHCSTVAAMGICPEAPATEDTICRPHHPYGKSKLRAEEEVLRLVREQELPAVIIRFSMVYGPGDRRDLLRLTRLAKKGLFPKVGRKPKLTPLIHVEDAVSGILAAMDKGRPGQTYLITNRRSEPFDTLIKIIQAALGIRQNAVYVPEWAALLAASATEKLYLLTGKAPPITRKNIESTLADRVFSIDKAQRELGFKPEIDPAQGLKETVEWYKTQGWV